MILRGDVYGTRFDPTEGSEQAPLTAFDLPGETAGGG